MFFCEFVHFSQFGSGELSKNFKICFSMFWKLTGNAFFKQTFSQLYSLGLWDAVIIIHQSILSKYPVEKVSISVEQSQISIVFFQNLFKLSIIEFFKLGEESLAS